MDLTNNDCTNIVNNTSSKENIWYLKFFFSENVRHFKFFFMNIYIYIYDTQVFFITIYDTFFFFLGWKLIMKEWVISRGDLIRHKADESQDF